MDDISIDRLILDIPGLTIEEAEDLALRIGEGLAAGENISGSFETLTVDVKGQISSLGVPRFANSIVTSLLRQME